MAQLSHPDLPAGISPDLVDATRREAELCADLVGLLLKELGLDPAVRLPAAFLLELAAAARRRAWEFTGIRTHLEAGLPPARQALASAFGVLEEPAGPEAGDPPAPLWPRVLDLFRRRFAWGGHSELDADVALGEADEDALLEALADFLWQRRRGRGGREE